ncbi:type 1 fimbriae major subunit FimA [Candidatus Burkholderia humilis]|nr:type 1 fimbriae major subunit FimA [Candidatus Burkholderia humilis]
MNKLNKILLAFFVTTAAGSVFAADANLNFTGQILAASCSVDSSSANQTIDLGSAYVGTFASVGSISNAKAFNINLNNCSANAKVSMNVTGTMDSVVSVLKNTGSATGVGIQLLSASAVGSTTGTPITLNSTISVGTVNASNAMTIPFAAQFYRLGTMTAGSVTTTATVNFTYN